VGVRGRMNGGRMSGGECVRMSDRVSDRMSVGVRDE